MPLLRRILADFSNDFPLTANIVHIGKSSDNDIVLDCPKSPDIAVEIKFCNGSYKLSAFPSASVKVNGEKCKTSTLLPGDRIEIGSDSFIFDHEVAPVKTGEDFKNAESVLDGLMHFAEIAGKERDLQKLLSIILDILLKTIGGDDACIFKLDFERKPQIVVCSDTKSSKNLFSDTIIQQTLKEGVGIYVQNALQDPNYKNSQSIADLQLTSVLCSPIMVAGNVIGIIYLGAKSYSQTFSASDLKLLNTYAVLAGTLINHVEYITQQRLTIRKLTESGTFHDGIIAESKVMMDILEGIDSIAESDIGILLEGETGTGKDVIARFIHKKSKRCKRNMIVINCSSIQKDLQESELFGHMRGSFTGAVCDHTGLFKAADGGTLFLDEIGDMNISLQAKFLRTLETGTIRPVGSAHEEQIDTRIICATNKNLESMVEDGTFRKDLYYRINQFRFRLPPLRDRGDDSIHIAYYFLEKYKAEYPNRTIIDFHPDTLQGIKTYSWPGNVRELASAVHKTVLSSSSPMGCIEFPSSFSTCQMTFEEEVMKFQKDLIRRTLRSVGGNKEQAAKVLGLGRSTFFRYLASFDL